MKLSTIVSRRIMAAIATLLFASIATIAQSEPVADSISLYSKLKSFDLNGGSASVSNLTFKRDRVAITLTGTLYFTSPLNGKVTGAVFVGNGSLKADLPPSDFEKANVRRLLKADVVATDFTTAVFRFTDDTAAVLAKETRSDPATPQAQKLATEINERMLRETGANLASRLAISILNNEDPGFFYASFDGGKLGGLSYILDHQNRLPTAYFGINGGEKGLLYTFRGSTADTEVLLAFYAESDYANAAASYSDAHDIVDVEHYDMLLDLRSPKSKLGQRSKATMRPLIDGVRAIPFSLGENLGVYEDARSKKQIKIKTVRRGSEPVPFVQENWEGGLTVFLANAAQKGQQLDIEFEGEGDFLVDGEIVRGCSYPRSNESWYPRHGYLDRSTYTLSYLHSRKLKVASVGLRESEIPWAEDKDVTITRYKMTHPVALVTFALGPWERHVETVKFEKSDKSIPLEFNSVAGASLPIKEDFILAELNNSVRYFNALFGAYPYDNYSATFHPYNFGQGFPSMLMIPPTDQASKYTYAFISHETAHQWWGNIVAWRSYRDQWLSEGFAEYSGALYTAKRESRGAGRELLDEMRDSLKKPPATLTGRGGGRLNDVGPIILGHRLSTTKTLGAYQALIYNKGALVLRMVHFLLSNPVNGEDAAFFNMMRDFTGRYRNKSASTDDFRMVAGEHFERSPLGRKYGLKNLDWFFKQWVYNSEIPSYKIDYSIAENPDGSFLVSGNVVQENVAADFFMPIPIVFNFGGDSIANGTVDAYGPKTPFQIKLPRKPGKVEIDPSKWLITDKISLSGR